MSVTRWSSNTMKMKTTVHTVRNLQRAPRYPNRVMSKSYAHWSVETRRAAVSQSIKCHRASFYAFARSGIRKRPWIMKR